MSYRIEDTLASILLSVRGQPRALGGDLRMLSAKTTAGLGLVDLRRLPIAGSDHLAIYARLRCRAGTEPNPETPEARSKDLERAREKIERGRRA